MIYLYDWKCKCKNCSESFVASCNLPCFDPVGEMDMQKCNAAEPPFNCTQCAVFSNKLKGEKPNFYYIPEKKYILCDGCKTEILPNISREQYGNEDDYYVQLEKLYKENIDNLRQYEFREADEVEVVPPEPLASHKTIINKERKRISDYLDRNENEVDSMKCKPKQQKSALLKVLINKFVNVETEKELPDCRAQDPKTKSDYTELYNELYCHAEMREAYVAEKYPDKYTKEIYWRNIKSLQCSPEFDYYLPDVKVIVEYDEKQHFTFARKLSLQNYPPNINLNFSINEWVAYCETINAKHKPWETRDEQRAYYDSVRDIEASRNGYTLIRIKHGNFNWISSSQNKIDIELKRLGILRDGDK